MLVIHHFFSNLVPWTMARINIYKKWRQWDSQLWHINIATVYSTCLSPQYDATGWQKLFSRSAFLSQKMQRSLPITQGKSEVSLHFFCWKLAVLFIEKRFVSLYLLHFCALTSPCTWKVHILHTASMYSSIMLQLICITETCIIAEATICEIHWFLHVRCDAPSSVKACSTQYNAGKEGHISTGKTQNLSNLTRHVCCLSTVIMNIHKRYRALYATTHMHLNINLPQLMKRAYCIGDVTLV